MLDEIPTLFMQEKGFLFMWFWARFVRPKPHNLFFPLRLQEKGDEQEFLSKRY